MSGQKNDSQSAAKMPPKKPFLPQVQLESFVPIDHTLRPIRMLTLIGSASLQDYLTRAQLLKVRYNNSQ
jgi:hypothetical protein